MACAVAFLCAAKVIGKNGNEKQKSHNFISKINHQLCDLENGNSQSATGFAVRLYHRIDLIKSIQ